MLPGPSRPPDYDHIGAKSVTSAFDATPSRRAQQTPQLKRWRSSRCRHSFKMFHREQDLDRSSLGLYDFAVLPRSVPASDSGPSAPVQFPWLVIVPGASFFYPWTLITAAFCETSTLEFLVSIVSLPLAARYLERQWGAAELIKFAAVILVVSNIIAWGLQLLLFAVFRKEALIWGIQYHGLQALQTGFLVAFTQLIPEHQVQVLSGALKLRVKDLPMLYVTVSNVMCLIGYNSPWILIQFGWLFSWAYLRFFKLNESGYRGDRSEAFAFVNWFPPFAHKPVQFISTTLFNIFVKVGVVQPWTGGDYADLESASLNGQPQQHGSARAEAERDERWR